LGTVKDAESGLEIRIGELTVRLDAAEAVSAYYESIASRMERLARGEDAA
jgi:hypothetical protein